MNREQLKQLENDLWSASDNLRANSQTQKTVENTVQEILDTHLPDSYDRKSFKKACDNIYNLVFEFAQQGRKWRA